MNIKNNTKNNLKKGDASVIYYVLANVLCVLSIVLVCIRLLKGFKTYGLVFSLGINSLSICIVSFLIHSCLRNKKYTYKYDIKFEKFLFVVLVSLFSDLCRLLVNGFDQPFLLIMNYFYNIVYHLMVILQVYLFVDYVNDQKWGNKKAIKWYKLFFLIYFFGLCILFVVNIFKPIIFTIVQGKYTRLNPIYIIFLIDALFIVGILGCINYKTILRRHLYLIIYYIVLPFTALPIQTFVIDASMFSCVLTISTTIIFILDYNITQFKLINEQKENENNRSKLMLSQIQPHFVYNTLSTIAYLCQTNPDQAKDLTIKFSQYLRNNVDFKSNDDMIPFTKELESVKNYLEIEKVRFEERLEVIYEIQVENFVLPMLTLQPIVENAVKHGICKKKEGGSILIASFEDEEYYHLLVKDNGVGFVEGNYDDEDNNTHIGIKNVRSRIENIAHGEIIIESEINRGTNVLINIPKNKGEN